MKASLFLVALLGATSSIAAAQPAGAPPAAAQGPQKVPGVSDAGNALLASSQASLKSQLVPLVQQLNAVNQQLGGVVSAPALDVVKFGGLLQQRRSLNGQILAKQDESILALLNKMTPADRNVFIKAIVNRGPAPGGAPR